MFRVVRVIMNRKVLGCAHLHDADLASVQFHKTPQSDPHAQSHGVGLPLVPQINTAQTPKAPHKDPNKGFMRRLEANNWGTIAVVLDAGT